MDMERPSEKRNTEDKWWADAVDTDLGNYRGRCVTEDDDRESSMIIDMIYFLVNGNAR